MAVNNQLYYLLPPFIYWLLREYLLISTNHMIMHLELGSQKSIMKIIE